MNVESLLADLRRMRSMNCVECSAALCIHEGHMSLVMGFKDEPRCLTCLAKDLDRPPEVLRDQILEYIRNRDCHQAAWKWACEEEGFSDADRPGCLWK